jgi:hypothetical protein
MWETVATYIEEQYDTDKLQRIWLLGDGAEWIDKGQEWLVKCQKLLDRYHVNKRFMSLTASVLISERYGTADIEQGTKHSSMCCTSMRPRKADTKSKQKQW